MNLKNIILASAISFAQISAIQVNADGRGARDRAMDFISSHTADDSIDINIPIELEILPGMSYQLDFLSRKVEPSHRDSQYFTVVDRDRKAQRVDLPFPVYARINREKDVIFVRQYKSHREAMGVRRLKKKDIPYDAAKLNALPTGTLVSIPFVVDVAAGIRPSVGLGVSGDSDLDIGVGINFVRFKRAELNIQVFKRSDTEVEVRVVNVKKRGQTKGFRIKIIPEVTGSSMVNNALARGLSSNQIVDLRDSDIHALTKSSSYLVDLTNPNAVAAYNHLMTTSTHKNNFYSVGKAFNQFRELLNTEKDELLQVADMTMLDHLSLQGAGSGVSRLYKIDSEAKFNRQTMRIGINYVAKKRADRDKGDSYVVSFDSNDQPKYFYSADHTLRTKQSLHFFGIKDNKKSLKNTFYLFNSDANQTVSAANFSNFGVTYRLSDRDLTKKQQLRIQAALKRNFPADVYDQIPWQDIITDKRQKATVSFQVVFKDNIVDRILNNDPDDTINKLNEAIMRFTHRKGSKHKYDPDVDFQKGFSDIYDYIGDILYPTVEGHDILGGKRCNARRGTSGGLSLAYYACDPERRETLNYKQKIKRVLDLHDIKYFDQIFLDFYKQFYPSDQIMNNMNVAFSWKSGSINDVERTFGDFSFMDNLEDFRATQGNYSRNKYDLTVVDPEDYATFK